MTDETGDHQTGESTRSTTPTPISMGRRGALTVLGAAGLGAAFSSSGSATGQGETSAPNTGNQPWYEWDAESEAWGLVFEWRTDPGTALEVDYLVDQPSTTVGRDIDRDAFWEDGVQSIESGTYRIVAEHTDKVLEVADASDESGATVRAGEWEGGAHQIWTFERL